MAGLGRYTLVRKIADGGMASIYLGIQHGAASFQRPVVIKAIRAEHSADPHFRDTLIDEAHIAMSLNHSNIVQVLDLGASSGRYFLILELVDGWDLDQILKRASKAGVRLPPSLALYITGEVCRALGYAHAKTKSGKPLGIVHRDVSPHNILISEQGEVKLTDFGIATASEKRERTFTGVIKGKLGFMSPEQAAGDPLDARSDLFALGAVLYVMATGKRPFDAPTELESLLRTKEGRFPPPDEADAKVDNDLSNLILRAMRRDRDHRFANAEEMLEACERVLRTSFEPVGATELKRWLAELTKRDGQVPLTKLSAPPMKVDEEDIVSTEGGLVLSEVERGKAPPPPPPDAKRKAPPPPPEPTPAAGPPPAPIRRSRSLGVVAIGLVGAGAIGAGLAAHYRSRMAALQQREPPSPTAVASVEDAGASDSGSLAVNVVDSGALAAAAVDAGALDAGATAEAANDAGPAEVAQTEHDDDDTPKPRPSFAEEPDDAGTREVVSVHFVSEPPGAAVRVEKKTFGATPISIRFRSGVFYNVVFTLEGFPPVEKKIYVSGKRAEQGVKVKLKK